MDERASSDPVHAVRVALDAVVAGIGVDAVVVAEPGDDHADVRARLDGDGLDLLIGRNGETVDGLQYLLTQIASRASGERLRVSLDVGGYRARREHELRALAERAAHEAASYGEEIELDPMTPHDRRIIHMALKDDERVVTRSEGDEPRRCIVVEPAD